MALLKVLCFLSYILCVYSTDLVVSKPNQDCSDICSSTYPLHTFEKGFQQHYCLRGCRLHAILSLVQNSESESRRLCGLSCIEAYPGNSENHNACNMGCQGANLSPQQFQGSHLLVHVMHRAWISGGMLIEGHFVHVEPMDAEQKQQEIVPHGAIVQHLSGSQKELFGFQSRQEQLSQGDSRRWWLCVADRALPYLGLLLSILGIASCLVFGFLCCQSLSTAPGHRLHKQRTLSINKLCVNSGDIILPPCTDLTIDFSDETEKKVPLLDDVNEVSATSLLPPSYSDIVKESEVDKHQES